MMLAPSTSISIPLANNGPHKSLTLIGRSRAGDATAFLIPELHWLLDCGAVVGGQQAQTIFLTHTHADHVQCLPKALGRMGSRVEPIKIYLPATAAPFVDRYLQAHLAMIECNPTTSDEEASMPIPTDNSMYELCPVVAGQEIIVHAGGKRGRGTEYVIRVVECIHRIECVGYSIFRRVQGKLLAEYVDLPGPEIGRLRKQGVAITGPLIEESALVFLGDTTHEVFEKHAEILQQHATIMVECTYLTDDDNNDNKKSLASALDFQHMHWRNLRPIVQAHPDTLFLLIHFSLKYSALHIRRFFQDFANVHPVLIQQEIDQEWNKHPGRKLSDETRPPVCRCFRCQAANTEAKVEVDTEDDDKS
jgi:ribonuclease Z